MDIFFMVATGSLIVLIFAVMELLDAKREIKEKEKEVKMLLEKLNDIYKTVGLVWYGIFNSIYSVSYWNMQLKKNWNTARKNKRIRKYDIGVI